MNAIQEQALSNARNNGSFSNYPTIFEGFMDKGIPEAEIEPRVNIFTFHAWKALGRQVMKGQHGVKILTYVPMTKKSEDPDEPDSTFRRPKSTTVFHVSQTEVINPN